jgi:hypothetical protein
MEESMDSGIRILVIAALLVCAGLFIGSVSEAKSSWKIGDPIVGYWGGPGYPGAQQPVNDYFAKQLVDGGWNVAHCREADIPIINKYKLRMLLWDDLLTPQTLDSPEATAKLDALIDRVKDNPNMYMYFLIDEPSAVLYPGFAKLVAHLKEKDPKHAAYIDLFPMRASNEQLGRTGDMYTAYAAYVGDFIKMIKPVFMSYDNYHFYRTEQNIPYDTDWYFDNLAIISKAANEANLPFMNIIQASSWAPGVRVPKPQEFRWLVYTSIAYGAQATCQYVYYYPGHEGNMVDKDGKPTELYFEAKTLNRDFVAIVKQLQKLKSLGAYHTGTLPPGTKALPSSSPFQLFPKIPKREYVQNQLVTGYVVGLFGKNNQPTSAVIVNLDYKNPQTITITAPENLEVFDPTRKRWSASADGKQIRLDLPAGGGKLIRMAK